MFIGSSPNATQVLTVIHAEKFQLPVVPKYADFVDKSATGQGDLIIAFQKLFTAPGSRHVFAFALAAFIDLIVFLLAYSSGPYFFGAPEERWFSAGALLDSSDDQASPRGMARVNSSTLSPGEQQLCLLLVSRGLAAQVNEEGRLFYLLDDEIHEHLVESLANPGLSMRAAQGA
ncbi:MAG TPA: hypothetical protein VE398_03290 [Acidobacteriota bacterium]|nr:hypothetical protein [Acidobacteriota bacterium]